MMTLCAQLGAPALSWLAAKLTPLWVHSASSREVDRTVHRHSAVMMRRRQYVVRVQPSSDVLPNLRRQTESLSVHQVISSI